MKVLIILGLCALAFAGPPEEEIVDHEDPYLSKLPEVDMEGAIRRPPTEYMPGNTYFYFYEAQILTGSPETSSQYSGYLMIAHLRLSMHRGRRVHMKLEKVRFLQTNEIMPRRRPVFLMPRRLFENLKDQRTHKEIISKLSIPVIFTWSRKGRVTKITVSSRDTFWSVNAKKGVMSILNSKFDINPDRVFNGNGLHERTRLHEDGIDGQCKADYNYERFPYDVRTKRNAMLNRVMLVTKSRDLEDCKARPWFYHALFHVLECEASRPPISSLTKTRYVATKNRGAGFFIFDSRTTGEYSYSQSDKRVGSVVSFVVQRLRFIFHIPRSAELLQKYEAVQHPRGLMMAIPVPESAVIKPNNARLVAAAKVLTRQIIVSYIKDDMTIYDHMRKLVEISRKMNKKDLLEVIRGSRVHDEALRSGLEAKRVTARELILGVIAKTSTKEMVNVVLQLIKDQDIEDHVTAMMVSRLSAMTYVKHERMIRKMMDVVKAMKSKRQRETYKALLLSVGQLIHIRYERPVPGQRRKLHPFIPRRVIKSFYLHMLHRPSRVVSQELRKIMVVHSLGNCGLIKPCLDILQSLVSTNSPRPLAQDLRIHATYALEKVAPKAPKRVRKLVLPTIYNIRDDVELRLASYFIFLSTNPSESDLLLIAKATSKERNRQVRSFISSHLRLLSKASKVRCLAPLARNASRVLRELPSPDRLGIQYSRLLMLPIPLKPMIGILANVRLSPEGFLPRDVYAQLLSRALGVNIDVAGLGVRADDAQELLERLLGPNGTLKTKGLKKLLRMLQGGSKANPSFMRYLTMYNGMYDISTLSKEVTNNLKRGLVPLPRDVYRLATRGGSVRRIAITLSHIDQLYKVPTTIGMPFTVNNTIGSHLLALADISARQPVVSEKASLTVNTIVAASARHQLRAGPDFTVIRSLVGAKHQIQVPRNEKMELIIGWDATKIESKRTIKLRLKMRRPKKDLDLLRLNSVIASGHIFPLKPGSFVKDQFVRNALVHRSLPFPPRKMTRVISMPSLGLAVDFASSRLNFTGMSKELQCPFYLPRNQRLVLRSDQTVAPGQAIDVMLQVWRRDKVPLHIILSGTEETVKERLGSEMSIASDLQEEPAGNSFPNMTAEQKDDLNAKKTVVKAVIAVAGVRLQSMRDRRLQPVLNILRIIAGKLPKRRGCAYNVKLLKRKPTKVTYTLKGLILHSKARREAQFEPRQPLRILKSMRCGVFQAFLVNNRHVAFSVAHGSMGDFWVKNMQRIMMQKDKINTAFPDIQKCQRDMQRRRLNSPACYRAWQDINSLSRYQEGLIIGQQAPMWLKQYAVVLFNYMRSAYGKQLVSSSLVQQRNKVIKILSDVQLSPYEPRVFLGYLRILEIADRYINGQLDLERRITVTQSWPENMMSNLVGGLYPARCEVVSPLRLPGSLVQWRTFDGVDRAALSRVMGRGGRIVLVQDLDKRLQISQQRSLGNDVLMIRLRRPDRRVYIVSHEISIGPDPVVYYRGHRQRLPFILKNRDGQVILSVVREPTARSKASLTVEAPLLGCKVRTHPKVSSEIIVSPFMHSKLRGICGDFDGEAMDDGKGPMCRAVFLRDWRLLSRYSLSLRRKPTLRRLMKDRRLYRFIATASCPKRRFYPIIG